MITLKGTKPEIWEKTYHTKDPEVAKEQHQNMHPDFIIDQIIENESSNIWDLFEERLRA